MNGWIHFSILWMLTGSPVAAAIILLAAYAVADWYTFGFLRGVAQAVAAFQRGRKLRLVLLHNPHDRKARADLGEILISQPWDTTAAAEGAHDLTAVAVDEIGSSTSTAPVRVEVRNSARVGGCASAGGGETLVRLGLG